MQTRVVPKHLRIGKLFKQQFIIEGKKPGETQFRQVTFGDRSMWNSRAEAEAKKLDLDERLANEA